MDELAFEANQVDADSVVTSLVEGTSKKDATVMVGHSPKNQTVLFSLPEGARAEDFVGKMCDVHVEQAKTWYLRGSLVGEPR